MDPLDFYDKIHGHFLLLGTPLNILYDLYITCVQYFHIHMHIFLSIYIYILYIYIIHIHPDIFRSQKGTRFLEPFWDPEFGGKAKLMAWQVNSLSSFSASGNT